MLRSIFSLIHHPKFQYFAHPANLRGMDGHEETLLVL
jgi:hypothetical protein